MREENQELMQELLFQVLMPCPHLVCVERNVSLMRIPTTRGQQLSDEKILSSSFCKKKSFVEHPITWRTVVFRATFFISYDCKVNAGIKHRMSGSKLLSSFQRERDRGRKQPDYNVESGEQKRREKLFNGCF